MLREDALENISMGVFAQSWLSSVLLKLMMCQPFYFFTSLGFVWTLLGKNIRKNNLVYYNLLRHFWNFYQILYSFYSHHRSLSHFWYASLSYLLGRRRWHSPSPSWPEPWVAPAEWGRSSPPPPVRSRTSGSEMHTLRAQRHRERESKVKKFQMWWDCRDILVCMRLKETPVSRRKEKGEKKETEL